MYSTFCPGKGIKNALPLDLAVTPGLLQERDAAYTYVMSALVPSPLPYGYSAPTSETIHGFHTGRYRKNHESDLDTQGG